MKTTYLNKGGSYTALDGTVTPRGGTVTTDDDLVAKFGPTHFEVVRESVQPEEVEPVSTNDASTSVEPEKADDSMLDVTSEFPICASTPHLTVKKDAKGWWVFDGDKDPANEKALKKKEVQPFLDEYLTEE